MTSLLSLEKSHHWLFWNFKQNKTLRFSATDIGIFKSIAIRFTFPSYIQIPITNDFFHFCLLVKFWQSYCQAMGMRTCCYVKDCMQTIFTHRTTLSILLSVWFPFALNLVLIFV
jgi:hypothetical protein